MRSITLQFIRGLAAVKKLGEGKPLGKLAPQASQKRDVAVETDAEKLVTHCCGLNYLRGGTDPNLKKDSEYPEWLWRLHVDRKPLPIEELDKDSWQYWRRVVKAARVKKFQGRRFYACLNLIKFYGHYASYTAVSGRCCCAVGTAVFSEPKGFCIANDQSLLALAENEKVPSTADTAQVLAVYTPKAAFLNWEDGVEVDQSFAIRDALEPIEPKAGPPQSKHQYRQKAKTNARRSSLFMAVRSNEGGEKTPLLTPQQWDTVNSLPQFCLPDFRIVSVDRLPRPRFGHHVSTDITGNRLYATYLAISASQTNEVGEELFVNFVVVLLSSSIAFKSQLRFFRCFINHIGSLNLAECWQDEILTLASYATRCPLPPVNLVINYPVYSQSITVTSPIPVSSSYAELPVWCVLHFLDSNSLCQLLSAFLNERSIVVVSSSTAVIPQFIASLLVLLYPLRFCHTVIPVLPDDMLGFLEAPSVYIIGCHSKHLKVVRSIRELFVVDLDAGVGFITDDLKLNQLPANLVKIITASHRPLVARAVILQMAQDWSDDDLEFRLIQTSIHLFQKVLKDVLWDVVNWVDHQQKSFNEVQFLDEIADKSELPFFAEFARSNLVEDLVQRLLADPEFVDHFLATADDERFDAIDNTELEAPAMYNMPSLARSTPADYLDKCATELMRSFSSIAENETPTDTTNSYNYATISNAQILMLAATVLALDGQWAESARAYYTLANVQAELFSVALFREYIFPQLTEDQITSLGPELRKFIAELEKSAMPSHDGRRRKSRAPIPVKYITANLPTGPLGLSIFKKTVINLGLAHFHSNILRLFTVLAGGNKATPLTKHFVPSELFSKFYEKWKEAETLRDIEQRPNIQTEVNDGEEVLKISSRLCKTSGPPGWLILTTERLLIAPSAVGKEAFCAVSFSEVINVEFADESRLKPATVKIMFSSAQLGEDGEDDVDGNVLTVSKRQMSLRGKVGRRTALSMANTISIQHFTFDMNFEREETFIWYRMIRELTAGYKMASSHKFPELRTASFESVRIFDTLELMYRHDKQKMMLVVPSFTRLTSAEKERGDLDPLARMMLIRKLSPGANFKIASMTSCTASLSDGTTDVLLLLGCEDGTLHVYSSKNDWKWIRKINFGGAPITALCAASLSGQLWMGRGDGQMLVGDANNNFAGRRQLGVHASSVSSLSLSSNESIVCSISATQELVFISAPTLAILSRIAGMSSMPQMPSMAQSMPPSMNPEGSISGMSIASSIATTMTMDQPKSLRKLQFLKAKSVGNSFVVLLHDELFRINSSGDNSSQKINLTQFAPETCGFLFDMYYTARKIVVVGRLQTPEGANTRKTSSVGSKGDINDAANRPSPVFIFDADTLELIEEFQFETNGELLTGIVVVEEGEHDNHKAEVWLSRSDGQVDIFRLHPPEFSALPTASKRSGGVATRQPMRSLHFYQKASIRHMVKILDHRSHEAATDDDANMANKVVACLAKTTDLNVIALWKADAMVSMV